MMNIEQFKSIRKDEIKSRVINARISKEQFEFLKKNKLSFAKIANSAINELIKTNSKLK